MTLLPTLRAAGSSLKLSLYVAKQEIRSLGSKRIHFTLLGGEWLPSMTYFPINIGNVIIPIDELIFFRGVVAQPPTSTDPIFLAGGSLCDISDPSPAIGWGATTHRSIFAKMTLLEEPGVLRSDR